MSKTPLVSAETNIGSKKTRAKSQYNYDQVLQFALALSLEDRAELSKEVKRSVSAEVDRMTAEANKGQELIKGL